MQWLRDQVAAIGRGTARRCAAAALAAGVVWTPFASAQPCVGDCDGDATVHIHELLIGVNIAQERRPVAVCPSFACRSSGSVPIDCLVQAVRNALSGCASAPVTVTIALPTPTPTVTPSATPACPLGPGRYTITQLGGGTLQVATFAPFPFPSGGTLIEDVGPGDASCVHDTVVPFPGGFRIPVFCIPMLGATTALTQTGCGIGRIDSDGGSDFTVQEDGDTSDAAFCNAVQETCTGPAPDSAGRLDVTVGDGVADDCAGGGVGNALTTVPVHTVTWVAADGSCPDADGIFDDGVDSKLVEFAQILDLTTDTNSARFVDLDGDGCAKVGLGPSGPVSSRGMCIDWEAMTIGTADSGAVFSSGGPTYDVLFTNVAPNTIGGPEPSGNATCASPPQINFAGFLSRCSNGK